MNDFASNIWILSCDGNASCIEVLFIDYLYLNRLSYKCRQIRDPPTLISLKVWSSTPTQSSFQAQAKNKSK